MPFQIGPEPNASPASGERRIALVIGNSDYRFASPLDNPVNDAVSVAEVLSSRLGFEVIRALDIKMSEMGDVQEVFEAKLRSKPDIALLYYAGHGLQVKGINYFVPIDSQIAARAHLSTRAIRFNDILDPMAEEVGANLIFLDACRENPFTRNLSRTLGEGVRGSIRGGLARVEKLAGTFIAYATAPDEVASDGKGEHSPFTSALLKHIETPDLSLPDMMIDVRNSVLDATNGQQEPWDQSSLRARFCFVPKTEGIKIVGPIRSGPSGQASKEWEVIQNTTSLAVLARFKERHPESYWCDFADARAEELRSADELRRKAAEQERAKKWTVSEATSALTSKLGALTSLLREAHEKRHQSIKTEQPEKEGDTTPPIESPHDNYSGEAAKEREKAELATWGAVKDTKDAEKLASFLREWPDGELAAAARNRLAVLEKAAAEAKAAEVDRREGEKQAAEARRKARQEKRAAMWTSLKAGFVLPKSEGLRSKTEAVEETAPVQEDRQSNTVHIGIAIAYAIAALPITASLVFFFAGRLQEDSAVESILAGGLVVGSAVLLVQLRGSALTGGELGLYWFGSAASLFAVFLVLFDALDPNITGMTAEQRASWSVFSAAGIAAVSGFLLRRWWNRRKQAVGTSTNFSD